MMKIIDSVWFTNKQANMGGDIFGSGDATIGIVFIETEQGDRKAYIGTADGNNQLVDEQTIAHRGTPVYLSHAQIIINNLNWKGKPNVKNISDSPKNDNA